MTAQTAPEAETERAQARAKLERSILDYHAMLSRNSRSQAWLAIAEAEFFLYLVLRFCKVSDPWIIGIALLVAAGGLIVVRQRIEDMMFAGKTAARKRPPLDLRAGGRSADV